MFLQALPDLPRVFRFLMGLDLVRARYGRKNCPQVLKSSESLEVLIASDGFDQRNTVTLVLLVVSSRSAVMLHWFVLVSWHFFGRR